MTPTLTAEPSSTDTTTTIVYPISPDYVKNWTVERAIAELVSNAIDEDPRFSYEWSDGVLTIEDSGPGIPQEGLVLGWSNKSDSQIGMWGEGAKLACLVLARSTTIKAVRFETVGFGFVPSIQKTKFGALPGASSNDEGTEMMQCEFFACARESGTKITIECSEKMSRMVAARFLKLSEPGYESSSHDRIINDGAGGRVYIGGVLINDKVKKLHYSYDFALESAKHLQNRDRTVIAGHSIDRLVRLAWSNNRDKTLLRERIDLALAGRLAENSPETHFSPSTPDERLIFQQIGKELIGNREVCYDDHTPEAILDLVDRGYEVMRPEKLTGYSFTRLMNALGIQPASRLAKKPEKATETDWLRTNQLTAEQKQNLELGCELVKRAFGPSALGKVRVYEATRLVGSDSDLAFGGFYVPTSSGLIGLQVKNLDSLDNTLKVLTHEAAHRLAHRDSKYDWNDRTRGFEKQLGDMAALLLLQIHNHGELPELAQVQAAEEQESASKESQSVTAKFKREVLIPLLTEKGFATPTELADKTGITLADARTTFRTKEARDKYNLTKVPQTKHIDVIQRESGIDWGALYLLLFAGRSAHTSRRKNGWFYGGVGTLTRRAIDQMKADSVYDEALIAEVEDFCSSNTPVGKQRLASDEQYAQNRSQYRTMSTATFNAKQQELRDHAEAVRKQDQLVAEEIFSKLLDAVRARYLTTAEVA